MLTKQWDAVPPANLQLQMIGQVLGISRRDQAPGDRWPAEPRPVAQSDAAQTEQIEQLMSMFPQSPFPLPKPMPPEEYLRLRAKGRS